jgi:hypothetical protein
MPENLPKPERSIKHLEKEQKKLSKTKNITSNPGN